MIKYDCNLIFLFLSLIKGRALSFVESELPPNLCSLLYYALDQIYQIINLLHRSLYWCPFLALIILYLFDA